MPGLVGFIAKPDSTPLGAELDAMVDTMLHEKTYRSKKTRLPEIGVAVGWIGHPDSFSDCMPVWNEAKNILLMFTGEDFSGRDHAARLRSAGHRWTEGNASYLVHLYEEHGDEFLEHLNGTFAGVIVDQRSKRVLLFNDRYGLSRIYFHEDARGFWFASEAKALLRVIPALKKFDEQSLAEFFTYGCPLDNRSLFADVSLLPAAAKWSFTTDGQTRATYFSVHAWAEQLPLAPDEFVRQYAETLAAIVPRYFNGKQQVAASITGGLDSRLVAAWAPRKPYLIPSYTFSGMYNKCCDALIGERVAKAWQQYHHTIVLEKGFFADFPALAKRSVYYTDGAQDVTGAASLYVNRRAREIAPVRVTGNYGDEVMRDNTTLRASKVRPVALAGDFAAKVAATAGALKPASNQPRLSFILGKQVPWLHFARLAIEQSQLTIRTPFLDNALVRLQYRCPPACQRSIDLALTLIAKGDPTMVRFATDRGHAGDKRRLWGKPLEWWQAITTRADYMYDYGMPQAMVGRAETIGNWKAERLFLGRHKYYHFRTWYARELATYVKEVLLDSRTLGREHLNRSAVERVVQEHTSAKANHTLEIHRLLTYELTHRQFIDAPRAQA